MKISDGATIRINSENCALLFSSVIKEEASAFMVSAILLYKRFKYKNQCCIIFNEVLMNVLIDKSNAGNALA
jgi:hypothetical protein